MIGSVLLLAVSLLLLFTALQFGVTPPRVLEIFNLVLSITALAFSLRAWHQLAYRRAQPADGWVTICAWTKRVWYDGQWITFEEFLARRFNLLSTHGISDQAATDFKLEVSRCWLTEELQRQALCPEKNWRPN